jgi:hypothetical protein
MIKQSISAKVSGYNDFSIEAIVSSTDFHSTEENKLSKLQSSLNLFYGLYYNSTVEKWKTGTDDRSKELAHWYAIKEKGKNKIGNIKITPKKQGVSQYEESYPDRDAPEANPAVPYQKFDVCFFPYDKLRRDEHRRNYVRFLEGKV